MRRGNGIRWTVGAALIAILLVPNLAIAAEDDTTSLASGDFELVWERTEAPVENGDTQRSWLWGPEPRTPGLHERYLDSPGQERLVQYFDKGRMEVNDPEADPSDPWFVTSGLLTRELISGKIQIGDDDYLDTGGGASIHVAGDHLTPFPRYRDLAGVIDQFHPERIGTRAERILTPEGIVTDDSPPDDPNAEFVHRITYEGPDGEDVAYNVPRAFWDYLNAPGTVYGQDGEPVTAEPLFSWIYVMGYPIADPFWVEVPVGGQRQWVLVQPFERRVLTYTPGNADEWQVEMGNIGQHYRDWRSQYFDDTAGGGDPEFFGFYDDEYWLFGTTRETEVIWESAGTTDSFVPGSTLFARDEQRMQGRRRTYWSVREDGLYLHGWEMRDGRENVRDMTVYSPAIHVLPAARQEEALVTETVAISMSHEPFYSTVEVDASGEQLVSTPARIFRAWRAELTRFENPSVDHRLGDILWFTPKFGVVQWLMEDEYSAYLTDSSLTNDAQ